MLVVKQMLARSAAIGVCLALPFAVAPAQAENLYNAAQYSGAHGGQLDVPLNKSQILTVDQVFSKALIGNQEIADILPMTNKSLYVLGKQMDHQSHPL